MPMIKLNGMLFARMIKMLLDGATVHEIAEETGLHKVTVTRYTRELHKAKAVHVAYWEADSLGRECIKGYRIGEQRDVPRQKRKTTAQRTALHRQRKQQRALLQMMAGETNARP